MAEAAEVATEAAEEELQLKLELGLELELEPVMELELELEVDKQCGGGDADAMDVGSGMKRSGLQSGNYVLSLFLSLGLSLFLFSIEFNGVRRSGYVTSVVTSGGRRWAREPGERGGVTADRGGA